MTKKYVCMEEGSEFMSEDVEDAYEHLDLGSQHRVVEIELVDHKISCHELERGREAAPNEDNESY